MQIEFTKPAIRICANIVLPQGNHFLVNLILYYDTVWAVNLSVYTVEILLIGTLETETASD